MMASAPPPHSMPPSFFPPEDHLYAASRLSPASTASESNHSWVSTGSYPNATRPSRTSTGPPAKESNGLLFITGTNPADFKDKKTMTKVRKKAMGSYLEQRPKQSNRSESSQRGVKPSTRPRLKSDDSTGSRGTENNGQEENVEDVISNDAALKIYRRETRRPGRRTSPPAHSPQSNNAGRQATSSNTRASLTPQLSFDIASILPSAPIVRPMRTGIELDYNKFTIRPFQSIGKPFDPFRTMFQVPHQRVSVEEMKFHCSRSFGTRAMGQKWIPTLIKSPHAFLSTLCIASMHLDAINDRLIPSVQTDALRQEVIHLIGQNLVNRDTQVDDSNIIAVTQIICSEIIDGDEVVLGYHEAGVEKMVTQRGGLRELGVEGRLAAILSWVSLESAILRESRPRSMYQDYSLSHSSTSYPNTATIPESPIFYPRGDFKTIKRSPRCSPRTLKLLEKIRMMTDFFLHETTNSRQNSPSLISLYREITTDFPSDLQENNIPTAADWTYEAIRIASIVQATAIIKRIPLSEALKYATQSQSQSQMQIQTVEVGISPATFRVDSPVTGFSTNTSYATSPNFSQTNPFNFFPPSAPKPSFSSTTSSNIFFPPPPSAPPSGSDSLLISLKTAIQNSDLSDCWSDMAGVLLWIGLCCGAASRRSGKVLKKWFSALAVRCSILLCFEHPEAVQATLLRMGEVVEGVGYRGSEGLALGSSREMNRRESAVKGKRKRT